MATWTSPPPAEQEMREWKRLLDLTSFGAVMVTPDLRFSLVNEGFARMHGFRVAELEHQPIADLFPPARRAEVSEKLRLTREKGHCRWESENVRRDGSVFPIVLDLSVIQDERGELLYFAGYAQDITEEKKADAVRRRLASVVESTDEAISSQTVGGTVLDWNPAAERVFGYSAQEMVGRPIDVVVPEELRAERVALTERALAGEPVVGFETERIRKAGQRIRVAVTLSPVRDTVGNVVAISTIERDITRQKETQELAALLMSLVQSSSDAITAQGFDGTVLDWNAGAERIYGYKEVDAVGRSIVALIVPEDRRREREDLTRRVMAGERIVAFETERVTKDRRRIPVALTLSPIRDPSGRILGVSTIERDITEQKRADVVRRRLASLVQSADEAISSQTVDGTVLDWNPAAERVFGYSAQEMIGRSVVDVLVPEELRGERAALAERAVAGQPVIGHETQRIRKGGQRIAIALTLSPVRDAAGNLTAISSIERDITEQKKAQELGALLTSLVQSSDDGIAAQALDGTVLDWNSGAERTYGYTEAEMLGQPITLIVPEDRRAEREALVQRVLAGERVVGFETERVTKDGRRIPIALTLSAIRDPGGRVLGISTIQRDISLLKQLERDRAEWSSIVAHDLRQPASTIRLAMEMLARSKEEQVRKKAVDRMQRAGERLERMIQDLLDVSRIDAHRLSVQAIGVELAPLIDEVVETIPELAGRCHTQIAPDAEVARADPERVVQVLSNLLSNAVKYGDPGTPIDVSVQPAGEMVMVTVTNEGPGISADEMQMLFSRFVRTRSAQATQAPGLGLGLYICRGIVEAHGGKLWAESTPGEKTSFRFTLSRATAVEDERRAGSGWRVRRSRPAGFGMR